MVSVLGRPWTPRSMCFPGFPPELPRPLLGEYMGGWVCSQGPCCCPAVKHVDENQLVSLPDAEIPTTTLPIEQDDRQYSQSGEDDTYRARPRPEHQPSLPATNTTRPQCEWQARPRGPESRAPAAWGLQECAGTPTPGGGHLQESHPLHLLTTWRQALHDYKFP